MRANLLADVITGVTVGIMIIPQSISYAMLAGLPVQFGLYSSLVPVFVYSLFGSSRQLAVGPVAIVSLLLSEGLHHAVPGIENVVDPNNVPPAYADAQQRYNVAAVQICLLWGGLEGPLVLENPSQRGRPPPGALFQVLPTQRRSKPHHGAPKPSH